MERLKKMLLSIILAMGLILLAGCNKFSFDFFDASKEDNNSVITVDPNKNEKDSTLDNEEEVTPAGSSAVDNAEGTQPTPTPSDIQPTANIELPLYTVNVDTGEIDAVTALVPADSEITPELIVEKVAESMADRSINVGIENVTTEDDTVIVSFYKDKAPLSEIGSSYEAAILDAIAQSIIDTLENYNQVIFRAEGEAYIGSHIELEIDEVYLEDN
jgi:hypothetical protein